MNQLYQLLFVLSIKFDGINYLDWSGENRSVIFSYNIYSVTLGDKIDLGDMFLAVTAADKRKVKKIGITIKSSS